MSMSTSQKVRHTQYLRKNGVKLCLIHLQVVVVSVTAGVALLGVLARYLRRKKAIRPMRRTRKVGGRRTRNSMRSPNGKRFTNITFSFLIEYLNQISHCAADIISLAGSRTSARSVSPGGSIIAFSERLSLASGSIPGVAQDTALSPQQLGAMGEFRYFWLFFCCSLNMTDNRRIFSTGIEALEAVINYWEDALVAYQTPPSVEDSEFCREIQSLLDIAWQLQDQSELLFLDQRSVLFRDESMASERHLSRLERSMSDPNFDSAESFASALDQVCLYLAYCELSGTINQSWLSFVSILDC